MQCCCKSFGNEEAKNQISNDNIGKEREEIERDGGGGGGNIKLNKAQKLIISC